VYKTPTQNKREGDMRNNSKYLSAFIRSRRIEIKLSQLDLSNKLSWRGNNAQYISNIELGKCPFPAKHIDKLSIALQTSREEIIDKMVRDYETNLRNSLR
jgi:transcriptional regulator with XRE-family HTH domain